MEEEKNTSKTYNNPVDEIIKKKNPGEILEELSRPHQPPGGLQGKPGKNTPGATVPRKTFKESFPWSYVKDSYLFSGKALVALGYFIIALFLVNIEIFKDYFFYDLGIQLYLTSVIFRGLNEFLGYLATQAAIFSIWPLLLSFLFTVIKDKKNLNLGNCIFDVVYMAVVISILSLAVLFINVDRNKKNSFMETYNYYCAKHHANRLIADEPNISKDAQPQSTSMDENKTTIDRFYIFTLRLDAVSVDISEEQLYREDLAVLYEKFRAEGNKIKSDNHWKKQVQDICIWQLNRNDQFCVMADDDNGDYIPIGLSISFSPIPEGNLLAVVSNITIYLGDNPVYRSHGKAYLTSLYPPYGSPFIHAVNVVFEEFDFQAMIQRLGKYRYFVPLLVLDKKIFSQENGKEPPQDFILDRGNEIKKFLEKEFKVEFEQSIKAVKEDLKGFVRQLIFSVKGNLATKDDLKGLQQVNEWMAKLRNGVCLVLDPGTEREPDVTSIIVRLPDGEAAVFNVVPFCDKNSPSAVWLKCIKKNNTYMVKGDDRQQLTAIKIYGLKKLSEIYNGRVIAR